MQGILSDPLSSSLSEFKKWFELAMQVGPIQIKSPSLVVEKALKMDLHLVESLKMLTTLGYDLTYHAKDVADRCIDQAFLPRMNYVAHENHLWNVNRLE